MKQLMFLRHAKSDWGNEQLRDIDRHLNERGYSDAYNLGSWFKTQKAKPSLVVSSTAVRALSTALIICRELDIERKAIVLDERLYEAHTGDIGSVIADQQDDKESLLVVGHNPGFTDMVNLLSEELHFDNIPTCGLVAFNCRVSDWSGVIGKKWPVEYYRFPKELKKN